MRACRLCRSDAQKKKNSDVKESILRDAKKNIFVLIPTEPLQEADRILGKCNMFGDTKGGKIGSCPRVHPEIEQGTHFSEEYVELAKSRKSTKSRMHTHQWQQSNFPPCHRSREEPSAQMKMWEAMGASRSDPVLPFR